VASTAPRRCPLVGAVQDQVRFGCFVLRLGPLGHLLDSFRKKGFSFGVPWVFPWPPLRAWAPLAPVGGRGRSLFFPFPVLILVST
jgi:hypothetical protein